MPESTNFQIQFFGSLLERQFCFHCTDAAVNLFYDRSRPAIGMLLPEVVSTANPTPACLTSTYFNASGIRGCLVLSIHR